MESLLIFAKRPLTGQVKTRLAAERDAEGIEHYVSEATMQAFQDWTGKIRS